MVESPPMAPDAAVSGAASSPDRRFLDQLGSAAELVAARQFREAEVEVLRALSIAPSELRALKLLALVRFKLGRFEEARAVCRELAVALPRDARIRLKLGLIALKLDHVDEAVHELELSARIVPDDVRVWSYLGFAYARRGERTRAAAAFRRAGEEDHAREAERGELGGSDAVPVGDDSGPVVAEAAAAAVAAAADEGVFDRSAPFEARQALVRQRLERGSDSESLFMAAGRGGEDVPVTPLVGFAVSRLAPDSDQPSWVGATARLPVTPEADVIVRQDAAVACSGAVTWEDAPRHVRGRDSGVRLGEEGADDAAGPAFLRIRGSGDLFVGAPAGRPVPLSLDGDTLYLREDRVLAFDGGLAWEAGAIPRVGVRMLQFRGRGLVALAAAGEPGAVKVTADRPVFVSPGALLGWVGNIVAVGRASLGTAPIGPFAVTCEGDGVVLMDVARGSDKERP